MLIGRISKTYCSRVDDGRRSFQEFAHRMPPRSEAQRRAMEAAAHGHSTLGIPKKVGEEYDEADEGGKLPKKVKKDRQVTLSQPRPIVEAAPLGSSADRPRQVSPADSILKKEAGVVKRIMRAFKMNEISAVDRPAQAHAKVVLMKRDQPTISERILAIADVGKRDFDASQRRSAASHGDALPDGSFPIKNKEDLANARRLVGHSKHPAAARALIRRRAKELGASTDEDSKKFDRAELTKLFESHLASASADDMDKAFEALDPVESIMTEDEVRKIIEERDFAIAELSKLDGKNPKGKEGVGDEDEGADDNADEIRGKTKKARGGSEPGESDKDGGHDDEDDGDGAKGGEIKGKMKKSDLPLEIQKRLDRADANDIILKGLMEEREVLHFAKKAAALGLEEVHGETLRKAFSGDKGGQAELERLMKGMAEQIRTGKIFAEFGSRQSGTDATAAAEMNLAAEAYRQGQIKIGKKCSIQQAFTAVYTDPAHADLKKRYDTDEMKKRLHVV